MAPETHQKTDGFLEFFLATQACGQGGGPREVMRVRAGILHFLGAQSSRGYHYIKYNWKRPSGQNPAIETKWPKSSYTTRR